jgi:hypothetical protein
MLPVTISILSISFLYFNTFQLKAQTGAPGNPGAHAMRAVTAAGGSGGANASNVGRNRAPVLLRSGLDAICTFTAMAEVTITFFVINKEGIRVTTLHIVMN